MKNSDCIFLPDLKALIDIPQHIVIMTVLMLLVTIIAAIN